MSYYRKVKTSIHDKHGQPYHVCYEFDIDEGARVWYEVGSEMAESVPLDLILSTRKILAAVPDDPPEESIVLEAVDSYYRNSLKNLLAGS